MRLARFHASAIALACILPGLCAAQEKTAVADSGAHIRILLAGSRIPQEATLLTFGHDTLIARLGDCCVVDTIALSSLAAVDVRKGISMDAGRVVAGMALGLMAGVGAGWAISEVGCRTSGAGETCGLGAVKWTMILGAGGLVAGALWGAESRVEHWERIYPPTRASIVVAPTSGSGVLVGIAITL